MKYKIIAFDVDGTLVKEQSSWVTLHKHFKKEHLAKKNLIMYEKGTINYQEFMRRDIALWPKSLHIDEIEEILLCYNLVSNATEVIKELKSRGYQIILISAGIDLLVKRVATDLGINLHVSNGLKTDKKGFLTGNGIFHVDLLRKDQALKDLLKSLNCTPESCITIGDSEYDVSLLDYSGCGIAIGDNEKLKKASKYQINELTDLLNII